jgi:integrase
MATAKKLPSGSYRVLAYLGKDASGKPIRMSFTADEKADAEFQASEYIRNNRKTTDKNLTVKEAIERYIQAKTAVLSPSTIRAYKSYQRTHYDGIGSKKVFRLTTEDMQLFISGLTVDGAKPKTVANVYGLLASSVALFRPDMVFRVKLPTRKKKARQSPSDSVVCGLFKNADSELQKCIALAAFASLRRGEICALKHSDLNGRVLSVHADMVMNEAGEWVYKDIPKTSESNRTVTLPPEVVALIGDGLDNDYIISISPSRVSDRFIKLCKRMGVDGVRFHDLRHYYASIGAVLQIPDTYLSSFGGWRSDSPIMKTIYQGTIAEQTGKYAETMNAHFSKLINSVHESVHEVEKVQ